MGYAMQISIENKLDINFVSIFSENMQLVKPTKTLVECFTGDTKIKVIPVTEKGVTNVKN